MAAMRIAALLFLLPLTNAFTAPSPTRHQPIRRTTSLDALDPSLLDPSLLDPSLLNPSLLDPSLLDPSLLDPSHLHSLLDSTTTFLSDATDAITDAITDPEKKSWWDSWLSVFRGSLVFIHDDIVDPVRDQYFPGFEQTWGVSIAVFTVMVRSALIPLSVQQTKGTERMKALKPYQKEINDKFKNNDEMKNRATSKLYEDSNTNPLAGCLVSILQLPIFLALYRSVTYLAKEGRLDEPFLWIPSLQGPVSGPTFRGLEWLTEGWAKTGDSIFSYSPALGWATLLAFVAMPVLLVLTQAFSMSVMTPPPDENATDKEKEELEKSQRIIKFLPLMIGYFSLQVPAGLTIYWFASNIFTLLQSVAVKQYYKSNPPKIELPDYWDALDDVAEMSVEQRKEAAKAGIPTGPKYADLLDEARAAYSIHRTPLREGSEAWKRVEAGNKEVVGAMSGWVEE